MIRLDFEDEIKLLQALADEPSIGSGSSRIVFDSTNETDAILNEISPEIATHYYVIKVGIGGAGWTQIHAESEAYENHPEGLATIYACGNMVEVMEGIDILGDYNADLYNAYEEMDDMDEDEFVKSLEWFLDDEELPREDGKKIFDLFRQLTVYFGHTSDNIQIGRSTNTGEYCAYDYGFHSESCNATSCSRYSWKFDEWTDLSGYFHLLIDTFRDLRDLGYDMFSDEVYNRMLLVDDIMENADEDCDLYEPDEWD